jgi:hypothetical protein
MPFDREDPPCIGRFGFGSGFHVPEFEEERRAGGDPAGYCLTCPLKEDCCTFSMTLAGIDLAHPCGPDTLHLITMNWCAGRRARSKAATS